MPRPSTRVQKRRSALAVIAVSAILATVAAVTSGYQFGLFPPTVEKRQLHVGVAVAHALVNRPESGRDRTDVDNLVDIDQLAALTDRRGPLADVMVSPEILDRTAHRLDISEDDISGATQFTGSVPSVLLEPDSERRASQILTSTDPFHIDVQARPNLPVLDIYARAPSAEAAQRLAEASIEAVNAYLRAKARDHGVPHFYRIHLTELGEPRAAAVDTRASAEIAALTFLVVFGISCGLIVAFGHIRRGWRAAANPSQGLWPDRSARPAHGYEPRDDDWPHTTRALPWLIAGFIAMLWLIPFNSIALDASLPIDVNLDRLLLPVILIAWVAALGSRRPGGPRLGMTPIHAGITGFVAVAGLSVILNASELEQTLMLSLSIKKLSLLAAYVTLFLIVASAVRKSEVRPYLTYILVLSVICAVGVIWEYRFRFNPFYTWTVGVLPGFFDAPTTWSAVDEVGRQSVIGPAEVSLETVAMLSMALPIAIVRLTLARPWRDRILYALAAGLLLMAILATYRKSALLAPVGVGVTLAYFHRREMLKLAPLVAAVIAAFAIFGFNAFDQVANQFNSNHLDVSTVSDRVSDYDAVRPDVLSHPALGSGFGAYAHASAPTANRILDSELLVRVVETGLVGLVAFVLMVITVIGVAAPVIRGRDPRRAPAALSIAAAAAGFLVLTALFDEWSFPHAVYIFLTLAGLLAVIVRKEEPNEIEVVRSPQGAPRLDPVAPPATNGVSAPRVPTPV
jgi:hypothetical protein